MRVAVIGSVVDDTIHHVDGRRVRSLGGITYTVGTLQVLAWPGLEILPVCRVGGDVCDRLLRQWRAAAGVVRLDGLVHQDEPGARVELEYAVGPGASDRSERLTGLLPPLTLRDLEPVRSADVLLVNCITGFDVELEALESVAEAVPVVYLDVHALTMALLPDGRREHRRRDDVPRWLATAQVVQCNAREAATLATGGEPEEALTRMLGRSGQAVVVTRGELGASLLRPGMAEVTVPAPEIDVVDPTGAGDTFGAAFVLAWLRSADLRSATRVAARVAAMACSIDGTAGLSALPRLLGGSLDDLL